MKYFIYVRKSTDVEDKQILSVEAQIVELKEYASKYGLDVVDILIEKRTAKKPGRPVLNTMLSRISSGEASGILSCPPELKKPLRWNTNQTSLTCAKRLFECSNRKDRQMICIPLIIVACGACRLCRLRNKKCASLLARQNFLPPGKQLVCAPRNQRKNRPKGRQFPFFSQNGAILHFRANSVPAEV